MIHKFQVELSNFQMHFSLKVQEISEIFFGHATLNFFLFLVVQKYFNCRFVAFYALF